jgi:hypothetical protein
MGEDQPSTQGFHGHRDMGQRQGNNVINPLSRVCMTEQNEAPEVKNLTSIALIGGLWPGVPPIILIF